MIRRKSAPHGASSRVRAIATAALLAGACLGTPLLAADPDPASQDPQSLVNALRKGGYVIFLRHTATDQSGAAYEAADLARCETQRNLSAQGRASAADIGKAIKRLGIPVGKVMASPFCRARDTAQLAFGRFTVENDLQFVMSSDADDAKRLGQSLSRMLSTAPQNGTNTVLVSHSANLREAAGIFAKPEGAAYVYRPLRDGRFELMGKLVPDQWDTLTRRARSPTAR